MGPTYCCIRGAGLAWPPLEQVHNGILHAGGQVRRRTTAPNQDPVRDCSTPIGGMGSAEVSLSDVIRGLPALTDDQLIECFSEAGFRGKRNWLLQAAMLHEAQQRSGYGEARLKATAQRCGVGLRQAQKYALVWRTWFAREDSPKNDNVDAFVKTPAP
jgi:hypothetical protein